MRNASITGITITEDAVISSDGSRIPIRGDMYIGSKGTVELIVPLEHVGMVAVMDGGNVTLDGVNGEFHIDTTSGKNVTGTKVTVTGDSTIAAGGDIDLGLAKQDITVNAQEGIGGTLSLPENAHMEEVDYPDWGQMTRIHIGENPSASSLRVTSTRGNVKITASS